jgi:translation elongation factor EF-G
MIGVKGSALYDGNYRRRLKSELAFNLAGVISSKEGIPKAKKPVILEPVMSRSFDPEEFMGDTSSVTSMDDAVGLTQWRHLFQVNY